MTSPTLQRPAQRLAADPPAGAESGRGGNPSIRRASVTAGVGLLVMSVFSGFGYLVAVKGLVVPGNAARTAKNIAGHEGMFRFGILSLFLVATLDVAVAWALYRAFRPVNKCISMFAAWLRIAYAGVFVVAISQLVGVLGLLGNAHPHGISATTQMHAQVLQRINAFTDIWDAGLVLFGFNLLALAYLACRSGCVPKPLSILLAIAGFGYVFDTVARVLVRGSSSDVSAMTGTGEFVFALWLVIRGRRIAMNDSGSHDGSNGSSPMTRSSSRWRVRPGRLCALEAPLTEGT